MSTYIGAAFQPGMRYANVVVALHGDAVTAVTRRPRAIRRRARRAGARSAGAWRQWG
jgi:hypothetical protein